MILDNCGFKEEFQPHELPTHSRDNLGFDRGSAAPVLERGHLGLILSMKVIIIHPRPLFCLGLERVLSRMANVNVKGIAHQIREGRRLIRAVAPHAVYVDPTLGDKSGWVAQLRRGNRCRIIFVWSASCKRDHLEIPDAVLDEGAEISAVVDQVEKLFRRRPGVARAQKLTKRELEVARLVADGMGTAQVAKTLYISENTIKTHIAHICHKLGLRSRLEIARWWHVADAERMNVVNS